MNQETGNNENNETLLDMNAMMEETLDTTEDLAEFQNPPDGEYSISVKKAAPGKPSKKGVATIQFTYAVVSTLSTATGEQPVPDGTMFSEKFQWTEDGKKYLKARIKKILNISELNGVTIADMLATVTGATFNARISTVKTPKNDGSGEFWENLDIKVVAPK